MRPDLVFSDARFSRSLFFITPARKPRTECGCQPVVRTIAAIVVPPSDRSIARTRACWSRRRANVVLGTQPACLAYEPSVIWREIGISLEILPLGPLRWATPSVAPPRPRKGQLPAGSVTGRQLGVLSINSNAPFEAEVQSNKSNLVAFSAHAYHAASGRSGNPFVSRLPESPLRHGMGSNPGGSHPR